VTEKASLLEEFRLERDMSFLQLSYAIKRSTGYFRNQDCWRKICKGETQNPQGRTERILDKFLASIKAEKIEKASRRKVAV